MGIKLELNRSERENYVFFCPDAPLHLSLTKPRGEAPRLSSSILVALKFGRLIDVEGVVDIENRCLKQKIVPVVEPVKAEVINVEVKEVNQDGLQIEEKEKENREVVKETTPKKRTPRAKKPKATE